MELHHLSSLPCAVREVVFLRTLSGDECLVKRRLRPNPARRAQAEHDNGDSDISPIRIASREHCRNQAQRRKHKPRPPRLRQERRKADANQPADDKDGERREIEHGMESARPDSRALSL